MISIDESCCRVCLSQQEILISLFDTVEDFNSTLCELLERCGNLRIDAEDAFPKYICGTCTNELLECAKFKEKCEHTQKVISNYEKINALAVCVLPSMEEGVFEQYVEEMQIKEEDKGEEYEQLDEATSECSADRTDALIEEIAGSTKLEDESPEQATLTLHNLVEEYQEIEFSASEASDFENWDVFETEDQTADYTENVINSVIKAETDTELLVKGIKPKKMKKTSKKSQKKSKIRLKDNFKCYVCGAVFTIAGNLEKHLYSHNPEEIYNCVTCDYCFLSFEDLQQHAKDHSLEEVAAFAEKDTCEPDEEENFPQGAADNVKKKNHWCNLCDKNFVSRSALRTHHRIHSGDRPFLCIHCPKTFKTQGGVDLHLRRHDGVKPFTCKICEKSFTDSSNLNVHMRSHTGEKPHKCTLCGRGFTRVFLLQIHQRTHTGERPYACSVCTRAFAQQGDLAAHKRIHSGERPHKCSICSKAFIKSSGLKQHMKKHLRWQSRSDFPTSVNWEGSSTDRNETGVAVENSSNLSSNLNTVDHYIIQEADEDALFETYEQIAEHVDELIDALETDS